jgi:hypothetical protein
VRDSMKFVLADCVEQVFEAALRDGKRRTPRRAKPKVTKAKGRAQER